MSLTWMASKTAMTATDVVMMGHLGPQALAAGALGGNLYMAQKLLRHSSPAMTQRYAHLSQATLLEAVDSLSAVSGLALTPA